MSTSTSGSCAWDGAQALVTKIKDQELNMTDLVAQCAGICDVAFVSNRSELVGPGIMISSAIQAVLLTTLGISLAAIIFTINKLSSSKPAPLTVLLRKFQAPLLLTNAFVSTTILVAARLMYNATSPLSFLELTFISNLVDFQFSISLAMILSQGADETMNQKRTSGWLTLLYYVLFIAQFTTSSSIKIPDKTIYTTLAKECHKEQLFINALSAAKDGGEMFKWMAVGLVGGGAIVLFIVFGAVHLPDFIKNPFLKLWRSTPAWVKKYWDFGSQFMMIVGYGANVPRNFWKVNGIRELVLENSPPVPVGEEWGYGQTTAVLLWLPLLGYMVKETIGYVQRRLKPENSKETESSKEEKTHSERDENEQQDSHPPPYEHHSSQTPESPTNDIEKEGLTSTSREQTD